MHDSGKSLYLHSSNHSRNKIITRPIMNTSPTRNLQKESKTITIDNAFSLCASSLSYPFLFFFNKNLDNGGHLLLILSVTFTYVYHVFQKKTTNLFRFSSFFRLRIHPTQEDSPFISYNVLSKKGSVSGKWFSIGSLLKCICVIILFITTAISIDGHTKGPILVLSFSL